MAISPDKISAITSRTDNFIRATFAISEFGDSTSSGITVDLSTSHDKIADSKSRGRDSLARSRWIARRSLVSRRSTCSAN